MIASPNHSSRGGAKVRLIVVHTAEGASTAAALGAYFARASVQASSHVGIDDTGLEQYVPYADAAWTVRSANTISDNAELCGFAAWTRGTWLTQHHPMLERTAAWIRDRCVSRGIPIVKLTAAQVGAGQPGVCGHVDWTVGMHDGTHTDPGAAFPWDLVMSLAAGSTPTPTPVPAPAPLPPEDDVMYIKYAHKPDDIWYALLAGPMFVGLGSAGEKQAADAAIAKGAVVQWVEAYTWAELDKRSHAVCDSPRLVTATTPTATVSPATA